MDALNDRNDALLGRTERVWFAGSDPSRQQTLGRTKNFAKVGGAVTHTVHVMEDISLNGACWVDTGSNKQPIFNVMFCMFPIFCI